MLSDESAIIATYAVKKSATIAIYVAKSAIIAIYEAKSAIIANMLRYFRYSV